MPTGRAAIFKGAGIPFEIREFPLPEVEPDAILVRVIMANICGSDLHTWRGEMQPPAPIHPSGYVTGHEMVGRVAVLGKNISTDSLGRPLREGDRVVYAYFFPCGRCYACLDGLPNACPTRFTRFGPRRSDVPPYFIGAFGEYYYLRPGHYVFLVPDELSDEVVAPVNCALAQVMYGLERAGLRIGDTVVLQGAGGLGLNAAAVAKEMGASLVIALDQLPQRLALARRFGADEVISLQEYPTAEARIERVRQLTGGAGAHIVMDLVGIPAVIPEGLHMLRMGGTYVEIGCIAPGEVRLDPSQWIWGNRRIIAMTHYHPQVLPRALEFLVRTKGKYPFDQVVSHKFPLEQINEAFAQAEWQRTHGDQTQIVRASLVMEHPPSYA
jgi:putative phosphonate catabolism associated alcohol dehydrogenase